MKVIDLFQGIARGEEVPKHIIVNNSRYYFDCNDSDYYSDNDEEPSLLERVWRHNAYVWLNLEVEIIEEEKEIEYPLLHRIGGNETTGDKMPNQEYLINCNFEHLNKAVYQLIDEVNKLKKNKE